MDRTPKKALKRLRRGLEALADADAQEAAALHIATGMVHGVLAQHKAAAKALQQGLALLPDGPSPLRVDALVELASGYSAQGDIESGARLNLEALDMAKRLHDHYRKLAILTNLGIDALMAGDWSGGAARLREAQQLAQRVGSAAQRTEVAANFGGLLINLGDDAEALTVLNDALALARRQRLDTSAFAIQVNLSELYLARGRPSEAAAALQAAEAFRAEEWALLYQPVLHRRRAQLALAEGHIKAARDGDH